MDLSIIIPLYNCEKYLERTFKSLEEQYVLDSSDVATEVILIDDGSTDSTLSIANEFSHRHSNIIVISKINEGQHIARNTGIDIAKGTYIYMMDDDDILIPGCLNEFLSLALKHEPDIFIFRWKKISESEITTFLDSNSSDNLKPFAKYNGEDYIAATSGLIGQDPVWNKLFRRDLLNQYDYRFDIDVRLGEDTAFIWGAIALAKTILVTDTLGYLWVTHPTSCYHTMLYDTEYGNSRKITQVFLAKFFHKFLIKYPHISPRLSDYLTAKKDSYEFAFWALVLRLGKDSESTNQLIDSHKKDKIYPIAKNFPSFLYPKGIGNLKFRLLWNIIANETLLKLAFRLRNFQLKLFSRR